MKTRLPDKSKPIMPTLEKLKAVISAYYNQRLQNIILYGSYARGDFNEQSDIDILVVINQMQSEMDEIEILAELKNDILIESDIYISTNPVSAEKLAHSDFSFL